MGDLQLALPALNLNEILVSAQGPLVLGFWVWGLGVWDLGLTIKHHYLILIQEPD